MRLAARFEWPLLYEPNAEPTGELMASRLTRLARTGELTVDATVELVWKTSCESDTLPLLC